MAQDTYMQVAPDSTGKKVSFEGPLTDAAGNTTYLQRALLTGDPADAIQQLLCINRQQLAVARAILRVLTDSTNSRVLEEDFSSSPGVNFDG